MQPLKFNGRLVAFSLPILTLLLLLAGCGGNNVSRQSSPSPQTNSPASTTTQQAHTPAITEQIQQPVTITIGANSAITDDEKKRYIIDPVKKKYPWITVEFADMKAGALKRWVAAGNVPDIIANGTGNITQEYIPSGLAFDLTDLIKKNNFDLQRINPVFFDAMRIGSGLNYVFGIPIWNQAFGLIYNKDLFDRFAEPYPQDEMTWDQINDIAVKMTRKVEDVQYYGLFADNVYRGANQLSLPFFDWDHQKAIFETPGWQELFTYWYNLYKGILGEKDLPAAQWSKLFDSGQLAMMSGSTSTAQTLLSVPGVNWDMVTYPQNPKAPGYGQRVTDFDLFITSTSKNKDAAFKVISAVLSDDVQTDMSRHGRMSVLANQDVQKVFGKDVPGFQGKNVTAFAKPKLAGMPDYRNLTPFNDINTAFTDVLKNGTDINTALRNADESVMAKYQKLNGK